jgi:hypothetical protein
MDYRREYSRHETRLYESFTAGTLAVQPTKLNLRVIFQQSRLGDANTDSGIAECVAPPVSRERERVQ